LNRAGLIQFTGPWIGAFIGRLFLAKRLGETLVQFGLITEHDLSTALAEHARLGERVGDVLVRMNVATEKQIAEALAYQLGIGYASLTENPPDPAAVALIPKAVCLLHACIAVAAEKNVLTVVMADPQLLGVVQDLEFQTSYRIKQAVGTRGDILQAIEVHHPGDARTRLVRRESGLSVGGASAVRSRSATAGSESPQGRNPVSNRLRDDVFESATSAMARGESVPIVDLVNLIVSSAIRSRASDIHVEPMEKHVLIRHRLDGLLKEVMELPSWMHEELIARVKITSGMDIAEKRLPQDGRLRANADDGTPIDFRVSSLRTLFGEKVVMRLLDHGRGVPGLEEIGMETTALEQMRQFLRHQHGMILVVGPTGSGKTTTLSSAVKSVRSEKTNIITIEDPIEYQIPGVNQTQINDKIKLTFASALRSILRQDPDVILVGEIRDAETATIAMQAAQTGHLVLSTLHTDDAPSCVTRLMDIGVEPYVITSGLIGVIAQRLVRRLCAHCRRQYAPPADVLRALAMTETEAATVAFYHAVGCDLCNQTGYRGRIGIYEVMRVSDKLRRLIAARAPEVELREAALAGGMMSLGEDGVAKVKSGVTSPDELLRVVTEVRAQKSLCAECGGEIAVDFLACPHCGHGVGQACLHCKRALQPGWKFCPYCVKSTAGSKTARRLRDRDRPALPRRSELPPANVADFKR
jgi:type IV pilus assembly protein PilB